MKYKNFHQFLKETNPPKSIMNKLEDLKLLKERNDFHPEENAFEHTRIVVERLLKTEDPNLIISGCLHDLFKHAVARVNPKTGNIIYPGHDSAVASFIRDNTEVREWIKNLGADPDTVMNICKDHMRFHQFKDMRDSKKKQFMQCPHWSKLEIFGRADDMTKEFNL